MIWQRGTADEEEQPELLMDSQVVMKDQRRSSVLAADVSTARFRGVEASINHSIRIFSLVRKYWCERIGLLLTGAGRKGKAVRGSARSSDRSTTVLRFGRAPSGVCIGAAISKFY